MQKLVVKWVGLGLAIAALATAFTLLGRWQLSRLDERRADNARIIAAQHGQVHSFADVFNAPITDENQWRRVRVTGTYLADQTIVVRDRRQDDTSGVVVVTPLRTSTGKVLLVDRGYLANADRAMSAAEAPKPPRGEVTVTGYTRRNERGPDSATTPDDHRRARLIRSDSIGTTLGLDTVDGYLDVTGTSPADVAELREIALPELSDGPHFWYAVQWFMFAGIAIVGYVVFVRNDVVTWRTGQRQSSDESRTAAAGSSDCG